MALLEVEGLTTHLLTARGVLTAVSDVDLTVDEGETVTVIGESGSGKSTLALSILRLLEEGVGRHAAGSVRFRGEDLLSMDAASLRALRRGSISLVPQDPMTALSPVSSVGRQMAEVIRLKGGSSDVRARSLELLDQVRVPDAARRLRQYPHELSGGMAQRVLIAMALAARPALLVADEPTSGLDVTVQASILDLLLDIQSETGMSILLITHDLGVARQVSDRVCVMYAGRIVETGPVREVIGRPLMPYTLDLMACTPRVSEQVTALRPIPGSPPPLEALPPGCSFAQRCQFATELCRAKRPRLRGVGDQHAIACHYDIGAEAVDLDGPGVMPRSRS